MTETFINGQAQTTLNGTINNSVTSLVIGSAGQVPPVGNFRIKIDSEIMLVTGVSGTTLTVTRGIESTAAASHTNGALVDFEVTAGALQQIRLDAISCSPATYTLFGGL